MNNLYLFFSELFFKKTYFIVVLLIFKLRIPIIIETIN